MNTDNIAVTPEEETEWKLKEAELSPNPTPFFTDKELVNELCHRLGCDRKTLLDTVDKLEEDKAAYGAMLLAGNAL